MTGSKQKVAILGAGITGLSLAWFLERKFPGVFAISIFDSSHVVGGWLQTIEKNGQLFECGPRSLRTAGNGKHILEMINDLGIEKELIFGSKACKNRYLVRDGKLELVPQSFFSLWRCSTGRMLLKGIVQDLFASKGSGEDESISSFFERRFGRQVVLRCIDPLVAGIYGASPDSLSVQSCFPSLYNKEQRYRSLLFGTLCEELFSKKGSPKAKSETISFKEGVGYLPKVLAKRINGAIYLSCPVSAVREEKSRVLLTALGKEHSFDLLFSTIQPQLFANLLPKEDTLKIPYVPMTSLAVISVGFCKAQKLIPSFGFLSPSCEESQLLGIVFDSCVFPEHNQRLQTRLSVMVGGERDTNAPCLSDEDLLSLARKAIEKYCGITAAFDDTVIFRAHQAVARYPVGHQQSLEAFEEQLKGRRIQVAGAGLYGVSVGDCIASAYKIIHTLRLQKNGSIPIHR